MLCLWFSAVTFPATEFDSLEAQTRQSHPEARLNARNICSNFYLYNWHLHLWVRWTICDKINEWKNVRHGRFIPRCLARTSSFISLFFCVRSKGLLVIIFACYCGYATSTQHNSTGFYFLKIFHLHCGIDTLAKGTTSFISPRSDGW
jgi:hypothetical protein